MQPSQASGIPENNDSKEHNLNIAFCLYFAEQTERAAMASKQYVIIRDLPGGCAEAIAGWHACSACAYSRSSILNYHQQLADLNLC